VSVTAPQPTTHSATLLTTHVLCPHHSLSRPQGAPGPAPPHHHHTQPQGNFLRCACCLLLDACLHVQAHTCCHTLTSCSVCGSMLRASKLCIFLHASSSSSPVAWDSSSSSGQMGRREGGEGERRGRGGTWRYFRGRRVGGRGWGGSGGRGWGYMELFQRGAAGGVVTHGAQCGAGGVDSHWVMHAGLVAWIGGACCSM